MFLKCPICGEEYSYDRKICQRCENHSIISGLTSLDTNKHNKWNCGIFLNKMNNPFGKSFDSYVKIASEPKVFNFNKSEEFEWNCDSIKNFNNVSTINSTSNVEDNVIVVINNLNSQKKNSGSLLIYE